MKTFNTSFKIGAVGLSLLCAFAVNALADYYYVSAPTSTSPWVNGMIYSVPAGANYEWGVGGDAHIMIGGGGLNVNAYGNVGFQYDVGNTAYADTISYQLDAYGDGGNAYIYVGW
jgi:hypothetical protein